jgi:AraC-like DNA-binding protein
LKTLFSTSDVHPRNRFDYWHSIACETVVDHASIPESRQSFQAKLESEILAEGMGLILFENSPMTISHTMRHVAKAKTDDLFVCRQLAGTLALEQEGRDIVLEPGDVTLLDPRLPYTGTFFAGSRLLLLRVTRSLLDARLGNTREMIARCIKPLDAENSLTSALLATLPAHAGKLGDTAADLVKTQVLDLLAVSFAKTREGRTPGVSSARSLVTMKVRAAVEARLTDPALNTEAVAAAAGVSVRYANAVLADEGTSIGRLIQARRLARCKRALHDARQAHRTVSEIAYGWGFSDMTHFARTFRAAYGVLPSEYRSLRP